MQKAYGNLLRSFFLERIYDFLKQLYRSIFLAHFSVSAQKQACICQMRPPVQQHHPQGRICQTRPPHPQAHVCQMRPSVAPSTCLIYIHHLVLPSLCGCDSFILFSVITLSITFLAHCLCHKLVQTAHSNWYLLNLYQCLDGWKSLPS